MFIEKLSKQEIISFTNKYFPTCKVSNIQIINNSLCIKLQGETIMHILVFGDFDAKIMDGMKIENDSLQNAWKNFLNEKFVDEYKQAYNENLLKKYEQEMIK